MGKQTVKPRKEINSSNEPRGDEGNVKSRKERLMTQQLRQRVANIKSVLSEKNLTRVAYTNFRKITPRRTGNAQNRTVLSNNLIEAKYPYAQRLDNGWSKQAPRGMVKPTLEYLRNYIKKQLGI